MNKYYTYKSHASVAKVFPTIEAEEILQKYYTNYLMASFLLKKLFGISTCTADLVFKDDYSPISGARLVIKNNKDTLYLDINYNNISFVSKECICRFSLIDYEAELVELVVFQNDKNIVQRFFTHKVEIELHLKNEEKTVFFEIPIDVTEPFDIDSFKNVSDVNLSALKKFYSNYFYKLQSEYDKTRMETIISIWDSSDVSSGEALDKGIMLDEITLVNNKIINCQLSEIRGTLIVTLKDGVYTVKGYPSHNKSLDINGTFDNLYFRRRVLDSQ